MLQQAAGGEDPVSQIFIGKVPPNLPLAVLEAQLVPFGASNVRMLDGKGCAFANFQNWSNAERAIHALNGVKLAPDAEGLNVKFANQKGQPKGREGKPKVFVGGLAHGTTEEMLFQVASQCGNVLEANIFSKRPDAPPCGFVLFSSFEEAEACIANLHGLEGELAGPGKTLNVRMADQGGKSTGAPSPVIGNPLASPMMGMGMGGGGMGNVAMAPVSNLGGGLGGGGGISQSHLANLSSCMGAYMSAACAAGAVGGAVRGTRPSTGGPGCPPPPPTASQKLFIGGLPDAATEDFVWGMMAAYGEVVEAKVHRKGGAAPCGFVRFATSGEAEMAMASHNQLGRFTVKPADDHRGGATIGAAHGPGGAVPMKRNFANAFGDTSAVGPMDAHWG